MIMHTGPGMFIFFCGTAQHGQEAKTNPMHAKKKKFGSGNSNTSSYNKGWEVDYLVPF